MAEWGNGQDVRANVDMESPNGYHLKVTNANKNGPALFAKNDHAGNDARALKVEGHSDFDAGDVLLGMDTPSHLLINDVNVANNARDAIGVVNNSNNVAAHGLAVTGQTSLFLSMNNTTGDDKIALKIEVSRDRADDRGLVVDGKSDFEDDVQIDGKVVVPNQDINDVAVLITNSNAGANARALKAVGKSEITGDLVVTGDASVGDDLTVTDDASVGGDLTVTGAADVDGALTVGPAGGDGAIDSGGTAVTPRDLNIGSTNVTSSVELSRDGQVTKVNGNLAVNGNELILDTTVSLGNGFVYDANGHGAGESIDVYIGGNRVGYWDALGWH